MWLTQMNDCQDLGLDHGPDVLLDLRAMDSEESAEERMGLGQNETKSDGVVVWPLLFGLMSSADISEVTTIEGHHDTDFHDGKCSD